MFHGMVSGLHWQQNRGSEEIYDSAPYHHSLPNYSHSQCGQYLIRTMGRGMPVQGDYYSESAPVKLNLQLRDIKI